jgi:UDP-GlcNAc:undecaprenyl-phosphate GlcNAc-1-phosphate transferase
MIDFLFLFIVNIIFFFFLESIGRNLDCYDIPSKSRRIHKEKVAKIGGFLILANIIVFYIISSKSIFLLKDNLSFIIGASLFFLLGYIDDKLDINANLKLFFQTTFLLLLIFLNNELIISSFYISIFNKKILLGHFSIFFTILCYLLFINAFNMLDGINLSAGIYALILLIFLYSYQNNVIFIVMGISLLFFLIKNYQNKLFLGNNGSYLLGFIFSFYFIHSNRIKIISVEEIFLAMIIPGLDMLRLYVQRICNKKNPFKADLNHLHHLLLRNNSYNKTIFYLFLIFSLPIFINFFINEIERFFLILFIVLFYFYYIFQLSKKN